MTEWRVFKPCKLRTREADPRLFQLFSRLCAETHSWLWERLGVEHGKGPDPAFWILRAAHISDFRAVLYLVAGCFSISIYFKNTLYHFSFNIQMPPGSTISIKYITHTHIFSQIYITLNLRYTHPISQHMSYYTSMHMHACANHYITILKL